MRTLMFSIALALFGSTLAFAQTGAAAPTSKAVPPVTATADAIATTPAVVVKPQVKFTTTMGDIVIELESERAAVTEKPFIGRDVLGTRNDENLADAGFVRWLVFTHGTMRSTRLL